jgi:PAT family beta-lactamase induction signal transducer AmpG
MASTMMTDPQGTRTVMRTNPALWVPTVYFAEGLPFFAVNSVALFFLQKMGVSNTVNTLAISLLALPWTLKPLWSPALEMFRTKKYFVILMEVLGGASLLLIAVTLVLPEYFWYVIVLLAILGVCSATHDIATDGIYIAVLTPKEQSAWVGILSACYSMARIFCTGLLLWLAGTLTERFTRAQMAAPVVHAWMVVFAVAGGTLVALGLYHSRVLPSGGEEKTQESLKQMTATFWDVVVTFFKKPNVYLILLLILLYRAGEGQVVKVGPLFLQAARASGGLGLSQQQVGGIYGVFGSVAFLGGSLLGGLFTAKLELKRALPWLILALDIPMLAYWYLSVALPTNSVLITAAMSAEMFGYGFGYVGVMLLMMQEIAPGKYQTAHYAFGTALMNLGLILPGAVSGWIQSRIGYTRFFIWVILSGLPALVLARFIPIGKGAAVAEPEAAV